MDIWVKFCYANKSINQHSEAWFCDKLSKLNQIYLAALKGVLDVRSSCPTNIVLLESGYPKLTALVKEKQYKFFKKLVTKRFMLDDDPFVHMLSVARQNNAPSAKYIDSILEKTTISYVAETKTSLGT